MLFRSPDETVSLVGYISGGGNMCVRLAIDLGIFDRLASAEHPLTAEEMAKEKNADPALVRRVTRVLVGMGFAADAKSADGSPAFAATAVTRHMLKPSVKAGIRFLYVALSIKAILIQTTPTKLYLRAKVTTKASLSSPKHQRTSHPTAINSPKAHPTAPSTLPTTQKKTASPTGPSNPA